MTDKVDNIFRTGVELLNVRRRAIVILIAQLELAGHTIVHTFKDYVHELTYPLLVHLISRGFERITLVISLSTFAIEPEVSVTSPSCSSCPQIFNRPGKPQD